MHGQITVIGSSNVDFIMQVERLPAVGETVSDAQFMQTFGGKGANQATAAARAGGSVTFLTGLGEDVYTEAMLANFRRDGMNMEHVLRASGVPCGSALVMFDRQGDNYLTVAPGANYALLPAHLEAHADVIRQSAMLVMQMEIPVATTLKALEIAAACGTPVLFNYAPVRTGEIPVSAQIHGLIVNENEAATLTGLPVETPEQIEAAVNALLARGPRFVALTLGAAGVYIASSEVRQHVPTTPVTAVDTTAAGDVFCGSLAVALVEGKSLADAARFANAASALSVTRMGAQPSIPLRTEIDGFSGC